MPRPRIPDHELTEEQRKRRTRNDKYRKKQPSESTSLKLVPSRQDLKMNTPVKISSQTKANNETVSNKKNSKESKKNLVSIEKNSKETKKKLVSNVKVPQTQWPTTNIQFYSPTILALIPILLVCCLLSYFLQVKQLT